MPITSKCLNCDKEFDHYPSDGKKYCSQACYAAHRRNTLFPKICPICGKEYQGTQAQIYCSPECKRKNDYWQYDVGEYKVTCPRCGKVRTVAKEPMKQTHCRKCAGAIAREKRPSLTGSKAYAWKGGRRIDSYGYVKLHKPGHPHADTTNYVREHIYVVCEHYSVDYFRENGGTVHHINGNKQDNQLENLFVCTSQQNKAFTKNLLDIAYALVRKSIIKFHDGKYRCPLLGDE